MDVSFTVPTIPVAQPRQRHRVIQSGGRSFASNYTPKKDPVNTYKAAVQAAYCQVGSGRLLDEPCCVWLTFVMPRPKRLIWKTKAMPRQPHTAKPDIDNLQKSTMDALNGLAFRDDSCCWWINAQKLYAAGDELPHVEIRLTTPA